MCGIIAFLQNSEVTSRRWRSALDSLATADPTPAGEWREDDVFLGHRRLSIIDLRTGEQPMHSSDGRYVIVFNGEIYNYRRAAAIELRAHGALFRTRSDTEVILEGYRRWGSAVVEKLNGMFAFVIWDRASRCGVRRARSARHQAAVLGDEGRRADCVVDARAFPRAPDFDRSILYAVRDLMTFDYIPAPRTIRKGVRKLEPGSRFEWRPGDRRA